MDIELYGVSASILIIALVQLAKNAGFNSKYAGVLSAAIGVLVSVVYALVSTPTATSEGIFKAIVVGLAVGLSAAGLYSGIKNAKE